MENYLVAFSTIILNDYLKVVKIKRKTLPDIVVTHIWKALKIGGCFCYYSPLVSQVEKTVLETSRHCFIEVKTFENIQREMIVSKIVMKPSFDMLGHTGYLTFARKVIKT